MDTFTLAWLVFGVVLMLLELVAPGLIIVFFGAAALLVGLAAWSGLVTTWPAALLLWAVGSSGLVFGARAGVKRLSPGEQEHTSTDEAIDAFGARVVVVEPVAPDQVGRIRFQGTTWPARTVEERLEAGARARIVMRDNLVWLVEGDDEPYELPPASGGGEGAEG